MLSSRFPVGPDLIRYLDQATFGSLLLMVFFIPLTETGKSVCLVFAVLFWVSRAWVMRDFRVKIPWLGWYFLAWLGVVILSGIFSECRLSQGIPDVLLYTVFFFLIVNTVNSEDRIWSLIWMILIGIGIGNWWGLYSYLTFGEVGGYFILKIPSLGNTGAYLVMTLSLLLSMLMFGSFNTKQRIFILLIFLLSQTALVFTTTRSMLFIFVCVVFTFAILGKKLNWILKVGSVFVFLLLMGYFNHSMVKARVDQILGPTRLANLEVRYPVWRSALHMAQDHPVLGVGHKCFLPTKEKYNEKYKVPEWAKQAHNLPIHTAAELGLIGVIALFAWVGASVYYLIQIRNLLKSNLARIFWFSGIGSLMTILIGGMVDPVIGAEVSLLFLMIMGLLIVAQDIGSASYNEND